MWAPDGLAQGGGVPPDYGFNWATITHAGNRAANASEAPEWFNPATNPTPIVRGQVNYEYRITKTEVTYTQYAEFLNAYVPYLDDAAGAMRVSGLFMDEQYTPRPGGGLDVRFSPIPGYENVAVNPSLKHAMIMTNWLHNDKGITQDAFMHGAYDLRNVPQNPFGMWTAVPARQPGARFWIPSVDEWIKAAHYDPDRYGPGEEGYWAYPNASNVQPIPGLPSMGGQTDTGLINPPLLDVGSYPGTASTWGLLDVMGGETEWTESPASLGDALWLGYSRGGGLAGVPLPASAGRLDQEWGAFNGVLGGAGFRLASIPGPSTSALVLGAFMMARGRRRARQSVT